ncbi:MAG TPA: alpha-ketoglutarate-dependent dioxygenase AlkB [Coleofasciculaceae cyanobacterium]|jgi:alkylated DNA repair dioxygenase AlkB
MNMSELNLVITQEPENRVISGLTYIPNYINGAQHQKLLNKIDQEVWSIESVEFKRRIQQHGYRYEYKNDILVSSSYLGPLPDWAGSIARQLYDDGFMAKVPDQVTVNEYEPGQGLTSHVDCVTCFGGTIITLSLSSTYVMEFTQIQTQERTKILLSPGSLLILRGEARYLWQHSVTPCKIDNYNGKEFVRSRRVALTFREALFPHK